MATIVLVPKAFYPLQELEVIPTVEREWQDKQTGEGKPRERTAFCILSVFRQEWAWRRKVQSAVVRDWQIDKTW